MKNFFNTGEVDLALHVIEQRFIADTAQADAFRKLLGALISAKRSGRSLDRYVHEKWVFMDRKLLFDMFHLRASRLYVSAQGRVETACSGAEVERALYEIIRQVVPECSPTLFASDWKHLPIRYAEVCTALSPIGAATLAAELGARVAPQMTTSNRFIPYAWPWVWEFGDPPRQMIAELTIYRLQPKIDRTGGITKVEIRPLSSMRIRRSAQQSGLHHEWTQFLDWHLICSHWAVWLKALVSEHQPCAIPVEWKTTPYEPFASAPTFQGRILATTDSNLANIRTPAAEIPHQCRPLSERELESLIKRRRRGRVSLVQSPESRRLP